VLTVDNVHTTKPSVTLHYLFLTTFDLTLPAMCWCTFTDESKAFWCKTTLLLQTFCKLQSK